MVEGDHPRIRGEHWWSSPSIRISGGSSPHTRGAPAPGFSIRPGVGIIPAYAGSTRTSTVRRLSCQDHPRIRGEHDWQHWHLRRIRGSSPHTRGALAQLAAALPPSVDHPRIRGEHRLRGSSSAWPTGSSPHTRGARRLDPEHHHRIRIIPAYAGSTHRHLESTGVPEDHPRIRGEHCPQMFVDTIRGRIIPAYAGSTILVVVAVSDTPDHPRIRGEHS